MRLQASSGGLTIGETDNRYLRLTGGTVAGNLTVNQGRLTLEAPAGTIPAGPDDPSPGQSVEHNWTNSGKTWTAFKVNAVNTASGSGSKLLDLQVGGTSKFYVSKNGTLYLTEGDSAPTGGDNWLFRTPGSSPYGFVTVPGGDLSLMAYASGTRAFATTGDYLVVGNNALFGFTSSQGAAFANTGIARASDGLVEFNNGTRGTLRDWKARRGTFTEYAALEPTSEPSAPASGVVLFCVTSGGKAVLKVKSPSGDVGTLYTEP